MIFCTMFGREKIYSPSCTNLDDFACMNLSPLFFRTDFWEKDRHCTNNGNPTNTWSLEIIAVFPVRNLSSLPLHACKSLYVIICNYYTLCKRLYVIICNNYINFRCSDRVYKRCLWCDWKWRCWSENWICFGNSVDSSDCYVRFYCNNIFVHLLSEYLRQNSGDCFSTSVNKTICGLQNIIHIMKEDNFRYLSSCK